MITIIQARMSSSRLPGKVLLPMGDGLVLDQVIKRAAPFSDQVVVCTSTDPSDQPIEEFCEQRGVVCVRGPWTMYSSATKWRWQTLGSVPRTGLHG